MKSLTSSMEACADGIEPVWAGSFHEAKRKFDKSEREKAVAEFQAQVLRAGGNVVQAGAVSAQVQKFENREIQRQEMAKDESNGGAKVAKLEAASVDVALADAPADISAGKVLCKNKKNVPQSIKDAALAEVKAGLSQRKVAKKYGVAQSAISIWLKNQREQTSGIQLKEKTEVETVILLPCGKRCNEENAPEEVEEQNEAPASTSNDTKSIGRARITRSIGKMRGEDITMVLKLVLGEVPPDEVEAYAVGRYLDRVRVFIKGVEWGEMQE